MKNLRVGMRVRILWSIGWPELAGQVGTIIGLAQERHRPECEWNVMPDSWNGGPPPRIGDKLVWFSYFGPDSTQLEPLYDGNETVTWESCAWKPEGVTT